MRVRQVSGMTTAEIYTKTATTTKAAAGRRGSLPFRQLLRDFQLFHLPQPVRVHITFLHLMASAPRVLTLDTLQQRRQRRGINDRAERKDKTAPSLWMRMLTSTCDDVCEQMQRTDTSAHAQWRLYLQAFIAEGEQINTLYTCVLLIMTHTAQKY